MRYPLETIVIERKGTRIRLVGATGEMPTCTSLTPLRKEIASRLGVHRRKVNMPVRKAMTGSVVLIEFEVPLTFSPEDGEEQAMNALYNTGNGLELCPPPANKRKKRAIQAQLREASRKSREAPLPRLTRLTTAH